MTSISSIETVTPHTLSPLPPSPSPEDDGSNHGQTWPTNDSRSNQQGKGKTRQVEHDYDGAASDEVLQHIDGAGYPPVNNSEAETRRVEENLRRWELAERQRRKAAREAPSNTQTSPSLVGDVSRRASLLWSGRKFKHAPRASIGTHMALQSQENVNSVPLEDINASPTPSPMPSPPRRDSEDANPENPFANPPETLSPFADLHQQTAVENASSESAPPSTQPKNSSGVPPNQSPIPAPSAFPRAPPTPRPLGLPPPRTPPPPIDTYLRHISPPAHTPEVSHAEDIEKQTRWWHDWLCGCSEGPDRGGDHQAGRTNPFE